MHARTPQRRGYDGVRRGATSAPRCPSSDGRLGIAVVDARQNLATSSFPSHLRVLKFVG